MTVEADIRTALKPFCPRVFTDFADPLTERPYITFQQIGGVETVYVEGVAANIQNGDIQFNVWADTRPEANALSKQVLSALTASNAFAAAPLSAPVWDYDPDMKRYCSSQDFSIWSNR